MSVALLFFQQSFVFVFSCFLYFCIKLTTCQYSKRKSSRFAFLFLFVSVFSVCHPARDEDGRESNAGALDAQEILGERPADQGP